MARLALVIHNVRSAHNVGSLLRSADGLGVERVYISGYSPHPATFGDSRLPHLIKKTTSQLHKTALGAEANSNIEYRQDIASCIDELETAGFSIAALEQTAKAINLSDFKPPSAVALVAGNEIEGLDKASLARIATHIKIPMSGQKESFNVAIAAAIALYKLKYS